MKSKLITHGAEAKILLSDDFIIKDRIKKSYRIPELDKKIRKSRTKSEAKLLTKASKIINCPEPFFIPDFNKIKMPFIKGKKLSKYLDNFPLQKQKQICRQIGKAISKLHEHDIIHGDLTTSNMILKEKLIRRDPKLKGGVDKGNLGSLYFIDFGLGFISRKIEDKAVDLHLLKQALEAKHFKHWEVLIKEIFREYEKYRDAKKVFERLKAVEKRGRYKH